MLSKMAQPNSIGPGVGGSGSGPTAGGRRVPLSLSGAGPGSLSRLQQAAAGSNGRSNSPQQIINAGKKNDANLANGPFVSIKKSSMNQQRPASTSSSSTTSSSSSSVSKDDKNQNGSSKSTNGNSKAGQNGSSIPVAKEHQKPKEKHAEKKDSNKPEAKDEPKPTKVEAKITESAAVDSKTKTQAAATEIIDLNDEPEVVAVSTTPTSERKSSRRVAAASQQKSPNKPNESPIKPQPKESPVKLQPKESPIKPQPNATTNKPSAADSPVQKKPEVQAESVEDVEMESLTVDASPIRSVVANSAQPTATSTPGRNLFGFLSASKQANEVERASQLPTTPSVAVARNLSQISGRRSIRPTATFTPGRMGNYRCLNTSDVDTSSCTNTSMNATVGSEIPNSSSFSFSFFGRGRKRERTPPPLSGSQSTNDLAQDVEMSPPKRARFDLFSMNLASPFTMLRSRFSRATISSPSSRQRSEQTPSTGDDEEAGGEVQNVSGIIIQEEEAEEKEQQLNISTTNEDVTVGKEAGLETPKKSGTPEKNVADVADENNKAEDQGEDAVANLPATDIGLAGESEGPNRSRCAIM